MKNLVEQALVHCLGFKPNNTVTIISDLETQDIGSALRAATSELGGMPHYFLMEDFGNSPLDGSSPLAFHPNMADALQQSDISIYAATCKKGELASFRSPMIRIVETSGTIKHGHMPDVTEKILRMGFGENYAEVIDLTHTAFCEKTPLHSMLQTVEFSMLNVQTKTLKMMCENI